MIWLNPPPIRCSAIADGFDVPPGEPRSHAFGGVACAARDAARVQATDGVDVSLGLNARQRLQLRLQGLVHRGATARWDHQIQLPAQRPRDGLDTGRGTRRPLRGHSRDRQDMSAFVLEDGVVYHTYSTYARGLDASGACTSGSTPPPRGATRRASGGGATTSTTSAEPSRGCRWRN